MNHRFSAVIKAERGRGEDGDSPEGEAAALPIRHSGFLPATTDRLDAASGRQANPDSCLFGK